MTPCAQAQDLQYHFYGTADAKVATTDWSSYTQDVWY